MPRTFLPAPPCSSLRRRAATSLTLVAALTAAALAPTLAVADDATPQYRPVTRPHSADVAERWWRSCTSALPVSADAAERVAAGCW
jgi:hypothetical protein